jgi:hypothetical protein
MKAAGIGSSLLVIIALVIALLKSLISFVGFLTMAFKILIVLVFIALILGVGFLILKGISDRRRSRD